jgi:tRNA nucleotidyltransferase/poly(A) polymerase
MTALNTDIQSSLTDDEKDLFGILTDVASKEAPGLVVRIAGGWVRDKVLGMPSDDFDVMVDTMSGADFASLVSGHLGNATAHVIKANPSKSKHVETANMKILLPSGATADVDFTRCRTESYQPGSRIPDVVEPATAEEDSFRRDLTINALFWNVTEQKLEDFTKDGLLDLENKIARTPKDPVSTFQEDELRVLRVIRFAAKYDLEIRPDVAEAMGSPFVLDALGDKISKERVGEEILKMAGGPNPARAIDTMKNFGIIDRFFRDALSGSKYEGEMSPLDMDQNNPHHDLSLWDHTMAAVKNIFEEYKEEDVEKRTIMVMSAFSHDFGKLHKDIQIDKDGKTGYHGHEESSFEISKLLFDHLKLGSVSEDITKIAHNHMRVGELTRAKATSLRRFVRKMAKEGVDWNDLIRLSIADGSAKKAPRDQAFFDKFDELGSRIAEAEKSLTPTKEGVIKPILNGNEVMAVLECGPGKHMGPVMAFVETLRDENPEITKEAAIESLKEWWNQLDE